MYMANGNKIYFKNMLVENSDYEELSQIEHILRVGPIT